MSLMNKCSLFTLTSLVLLAAAPNAFAQGTDANPFTAYEGCLIQLRQIEGPADPFAGQDVPLNVGEKDQAPSEDGSLDQSAGESTDTEGQGEDSSSPDSAASDADKVAPLTRILERNRFSINAAAALSFDASVGKTFDGTKSESGYSLNALTVLGVGYNVWDNVTLELVAGSLWHPSALHRDLAMEQDWIFLLRGWYQYALGNRTALLGGLGLGGFFGSSKYESQSAKGAAATKGTPRIKSAGFAMKVDGGVSYLFGDSWQMRMLLDFTYLGGKHEIPVIKKSLANHSMHLGLELGVVYTF